MKKNKWLVAAVLAVLAIGGVYGGLSHVAKRVEAAVRDTISGMGDVSVGSVRFTMPGRKLAIKDAAVKLPGLSFVDSVKVKSFEAVLPWGLVLSPKLEGGALVAETLDMRGVEYEYVMQNMNMTVSFARESAREVRTNPAMLLRLLSAEKLDVADMIAVYENTSLARYEGEGLVWSAPDSAMRVEKIVMEGMNGLRIDRQRLTGLAMSVALAPRTDPETVFEVASVSVEKVDIPADALRSLLEMQSLQSLSGKQADAFMEKLFAGAVPLVGSIEMQGLKAAEKLFPVSLRLFRLDWLSAAPLHYTMKIDGLAAASEVIAGNAGLQLPNLPFVDVFIRTEEKHDAAGKVNMHDLYSAKDLFNADVRARLVLADAGKLPSLHIWNYSRMANAAIAGFDLELEDKNLMAYVLLNIEGSLATGDGLLRMLPLRPGANKAGHKKMMDSLEMFIKRPGRLSVNFAPENPVPLAELAGMLRDPSAFLTISATPGAMSVQDMIKKILEPAGK